VNGETAMAGYARQISIISSTISVNLSSLIIYIHEYISIGHEVG